MITSEDIKILEEWTDKQQIPEHVRVWHAQVVFELVQYIRYLEQELYTSRMTNANLDEKIRLGILGEESGRPIDT